MCFVFQHLTKRGERPIIWHGRDATTRAGWDI
nr:MAG TPA: hypothetical protein [Caudoviricetes sp.]